MLSQFADDEITRVCTQLTLRCPYFRQIALKGDAIALIIFLELNRLMPLSIFHLRSLE